VIQRLFVDGFRCLVDFDWRPGRVNLLLGPNGAGKTAVFDAVECVASFAYVGTPVKEAFPPIERTAWAKRLEQRFVVELATHAGVYEYALTVGRRSPEADGVVVLERLMLNGRDVYVHAGGTARALTNGSMTELGLPAGSARSLLPLLEDGGWAPGLEFAKALAELGAYHVVPTRVRPRSDEEAWALKGWGDNFVAWYRRMLLDRPERVARYFADLTRVLPGFRALRIDGGRTKELVVVFAGAAGPYEVLVDELSSGQLALVVLYAIRHFLTEPGRTLLFDEPDNFVAASELQPWLAELVEWADREGQLFVSSHHPEVLDYLGSEAVWIFDRPGGGPTRLTRWEPEPGIVLSEAVGRGMVGA
jgi:predicted ATPase